MSNNQAQSAPLTTDSDYINFKEIKEQADVRYILHKLGRLDSLHTQGMEIFGACPYCEADPKKNPFSFHTQKKAFQCFACKRRGSILDFVRIELSLSLRGAGIWIRDTMAQSAIEDVPKAVEVAETATQASSTEELVDAMTQDNAQYSVAVMSFSEACRRIKYSGLDKEYLRVVDIRELADVR